MRRDLVVLVVALTMLGLVAAVVFVVVRQDSGVPAISWDAVEVDGDRVRVTVEDTACMEFGDLVVDESDARVALPMHGRSPLGFCTAIYEEHQEIVELDEPLGDRRISDGACLSRDPANETDCVQAPVAWGSRAVPG